MIPAICCRAAALIFCGFFFFLSSFYFQLSWITGEEGVLTTRWERGRDDRLEHLYAEGRKRGLLSHGRFYAKFRCYKLKEGGK